MKPLSSVLFFLMYSCAGYSQQLYFYTPDKLKQLPSSEVYNIRQDSKGYIWFSTVAGLCRYNGNSIKVFDKRNGLPEEACYSVSEDKAGRIWIATSGNRILTVDNDSLKEAPFSKSYTASFKGTLLYTYSINGLGDTLWVNTQGASYKANIYSTEYEKIETKDTAGGFYFIIKDGILLHIKTPVYSVAKPYVPGIPIQLVIKDDNVTKTITIPLSPTFVLDWRVLTVTQPGTGSFITMGNLLIKINVDYSYEVKQFPYPIVALYADRDNGLWLGTLKGGAYYFPNSNNLGNSIINLRGYSVSGICEDKEKGVWCSTLEKGVFYCRNKSIQSYMDINGLKKKPELFKAIGNSIFISSNESELIEINDSSIKKHNVKMDNSEHILTDLIPATDKGWIISGKDFIVKADEWFKKFTRIQFKTEKINSASKQLIHVGKKTFGIHGSVLIETDANAAKYRIKNFPASCWCIFYPGTDYLLSGCRNGLYKINLKDFSYNKIDGVEGNITSIISIKNRGVWISTRANGIYVMDSESERIYKLTDSLQLPTNRIFNITEDRFNNIWLGSNAGIIKIHYENNKPHATVFNSLDGLPSDEVFNVAASRHNLYFSTNEGICRFPLQAKLDNIIPPPIFISSIKTNKRNISLPGSSLELPYSENSLVIQLDLLTFKETGQTFIYKLKGRDELTHTIKGSELALNSLSAGEYSLEVYAVNNDSIVSKYPAALAIRIMKPFWQTTYFIGLIILLIFLVIILTARRTVNRIRKRESEKTNINKLIAEYRMAALRAQMNPHFIFNCINSIQRYIITNQADEAYHYLTRFSKLIRLVLGYSEENSITLGQELEIVQLYMELEQLRFENKFTFSIACPEHLDKETIKVPAMMLQPYIENAIWHGLMNLDKTVPGHISITAKLHDHTLQIVIEDNGVGRKMSRQISNKTHQSKATDINQKRTETLNILSNNNKALVVMEDINGNDNSIKGTRVTINIPQQIYENE